MKDQQPQTDCKSDVVNDAELKEQKEQNEYKLDRLSLIFVFILTIIFVISGVYLTAKDHGIVGGIIFSTTIVSVAGLFITGAFNKLKRRK